jgi:HlyD family secretion protein
MKKAFILFIAALVLLSPGLAAASATPADPTPQVTPAAPPGLGTAPATVSATGRVRSGQSAVLYWKTSGIVGESDVHVGEQVSAGQVLATLKSSSLLPSVILSQADLVSAQQALNNLLDSQLQQAQAKQAVGNAQQALDDARNPELAQAKANEAIAQAEQAVEQARYRLDILTAPVPQSALEQAHANLLLADHRLHLTMEQIARIEKKLKNLVPKIPLISIRKQVKRGLMRALEGLESLRAQQQVTYDRELQKLEHLQSPPDPTEVAVARADLATAQAQLANAQQQYARIQNGTSPADLAVLQAQLADAQRAYQRVQNGPNPDDVAAARARVAAAQASLDQAHLSAPFAGTITEVDSQPGDQVSPGTPAFRIDDLSHLWVDVAVSEVDVNQVKVGQPATLSFDAIQGRTYHGVVSSIAPVGSESQGSVNFTVTVELQDADAQVRPAMTAAVEIAVSQAGGGS